jgi:hypothetical protein
MMYMNKRNELVYLVNDSIVFIFRDKIFDKKEFADSDEWDFLQFRLRKTDITWDIANLIEREIVLTE